jgi:predicted transcriptional regulator
MVKKLRLDESNQKPVVNEILSDNLELYLQDFAQEYGGIDYNDISDLSKCWDKLENATKSRIRKFVSEIKKACKETGMDAYELSQEYPEDKENCENLVKHIKNAIKGCKKESVNGKLKEYVTVSTNVKEEINTTLSRLQDTLKGLYFMKDEFYKDEYVARLVDNLDTINDCISRIQYDESDAWQHDNNGKEINW